jgi:hypothetical protein
MKSENEKLYDKSVRAAKHYFASWPKPANLIAKVQRTAHQELYRAGWMIGYRAGRASLRRGNVP